MPPLLSMLDSMFGFFDVGDRSLWAHALRVLTIGCCAAPKKQACGSAWAPAFVIVWWRSRPCCTMWVIGLRL